MTAPSPTSLIRRLLAGLCLALLAGTLSAADRMAFDIPAGTADQSLRTFLTQSNAQVVYPAEIVRGVKTPAVKGSLTPEEAMAQLLADTPLVAKPDSKGTTFIISREPKNVNRAIAENSARPDKARTSDAARDGVLKLETFEVMGTKLLNMDIRRSRDDAQPYVTFARETIERSGVTNLEEFLKNRLTMNTQATSSSQTPGASGATSQVNLRGLGTSNTLLLVDGRRMPTRTLSGVPTQPDLNGIPLSMIERVEVLPATASGIYGGGATGGVINVILRRDFQGAEMRLTYENTFESDAATRRADFNAGLTLEGGKTNILLAASWSDANALSFRDRSLLQRGRARVLANNPGAILNATNPPLGATTNIRASGGVNLTLKNGTALNSPVTHAPSGYAGVASDGGAALVANAGRYNLDLADSAQAGGGGNALRVGPEARSVSLSLRRQFTPRLEAFLDLYANDNEVQTSPTSALTGTYTLASTAATNPFNQTIVITAPLRAADSNYRTADKGRRALAGVIVKLPRDWMVEADYSWSNMRSSYAPPTALLSTRPDTAAVTSGALDLIRDTTAFPPDFSSYLTSGGAQEPQDFELRDVTFRAAGPVAQLPGGPLTVSALLEHRDEAVSDTTLVIPGFNIYYPDKSQSINSAYVETQAQLVGSANRRRGVEELLVQLAVRRDEYETNGVTGAVTVGSTTPILRATNRTSSTDMTVGMRYRPFEGVTLRASYGQGFLPPLLSQVTSTPANLAAGSAIDPLRGNTPTQAMTQLSGGNPSLKPEQSESWSAGVVLLPKPIAGLRLSLDYIRIEKSDNIATLPIQTLINNESLFPGRVTRGPVPVGDPFTVGPITNLDLTAVNISSALVEAYDLALDYERSVPGLGQFSLYALATWQTHYRTQLLPGAAVVENVGNSSSRPVRFKTNFGATWTRSAWTVGWSARYLGSYNVADPTAASSATVILNQGGPRISGQIYHDVFASWRAGNRAGDAGRRRLFAGLELQAGVRNVFDREPPFDASASFFGYYSLFGDARLRSYYISAKRAF